MSQELRDALVEVGQETAPSAQNDTTVLLAYDSATGTMKPVNAKDVVPETGAKKVSVDITVTVGTGGDFATINEALEALSKLYPTYKLGGIAATINMLAGFVMAEQVIINAIDLSWITLIGEDAETIIDHTALTVNATADYDKASNGAFVSIHGGKGIVIGQQFVFSESQAGGDKDGVVAYGAGSTFEVKINCGINNAGAYGVFAAEGGIITAQGTNFTGALKVGAYAFRCGILNVGGIDVSGGYDQGIYAIRAGVINCESANAENCVNYGVHSFIGSMINARSVNANGAGSGFNVGIGSTINAASGSGTLSQEANKITSSGIIFQ